MIFSAHGKAPLGLIEIPSDGFNGSRCLKPAHARSAFACGFTRIMTIAFLSLVSVIEASAGPRAPSLQRRAAASASVQIFSGHLYVVRGVF